MHYVIISYLAGNHVEQKKSHLIKLLSQINKLDKDKHITLVDSVYCNDIAELCDIYVYTKYNDNNPHGQGDLDKFKLAFNLLKPLNPSCIVKFNYDYCFNENILNQVNDWKQQILSGKHIIGCAWRANEADGGMPESFAMGIGVYSISGAERLFNFERAESPIEQQLYKKIVNNFLKEEYYIYRHVEHMLNNDKCYDVFNGHGQIFNEERSSNFNI
jgi:hypothetical protein